MYLNNIFFVFQSSFTLNSRQEISAFILKLIARLPVTLTVTMASFGIPGVAPPAPAIAHLPAVK